eukprot:3400706-Pyramimonas_sp.AAC.1
MDQSDVGIMGLFLRWTNQTPCRPQLPGAVYVLTMDQSDVRRMGIFLRWTNQTPFRPQLPGAVLAPQPADATPGQGTLLLIRE